MRQTARAAGSYVMALDAGTGSGRAIIYDLTGAIAGLGQEEWSHPAVPGAPGGLDFDTAANGPLLDRVIAEALRQAGLQPGDIAAVACTAMREGFVLYDEDDREIWACPNVDSRARCEAEELTESGAADRIFAIAGDWVSITAPARVLWIRRHLPEVWARTRRFALLADWMATRLTGVHATEPSGGSSSALFDLARRDWSDELLALVGLDRSIMAPVRESGTRLGEISPAAAARCGLAAGTPVFAGGADTQLALLGLGRRAGDATLVGGSFWQMTVLTDRPLIDPDCGPRTLCHVRPDEWMTEGIGFLTGFSLRWLRDTFFEPLRQAFGAEGSSFTLIETMAAAAPPGAGGVIATVSHPMQSDAWEHPPLGLHGFDINNPAAGLGCAARAVMETGAFLARAHLDRLERLSGRRYETIRFTGGSARGDTWPQIVADVLGRPVEIPTVKETSALGCAMLAAAGAGLYPTLDAAVAAMSSPIERRITPSAERHAAYAEIERRWRAVSRHASIMAGEHLLAPLWQPAGARKGKHDALTLG